MTAYGKMEDARVQQLVKLVGPLIFLVIPKKDKIRIKNGFYFSPPQKLLMTVDHGHKHEVNVLQPLYSKYLESKPIYFKKHTSPQHTVDVALFELVGPSTPKLSLCDTERNPVLDELVAVVQVISHTTHAEFASKADCFLFPQGVSKENQWLAVSVGRVVDVSEGVLEHTAFTTNGSSGSPVFALKDFALVGMSFAHRDRHSIAEMNLRKESHRTLQHRAVHDVSQSYFPDSNLSAIVTESHNQLTRHITYQKLLDCETRSCAVSPLLSTGFSWLSGIKLLDTIGQNTNDFTIKHKLFQLIWKRPVLKLPYLGWQCTLPRNLPVGKLSCIPRLALRVSAVTAAPIFVYFDEKSNKVTLSAGEGVEEAKLIQTIENEFTCMLEQSNFDHCSVLISVNLVNEPFALCEALRLGEYAFALKLLETHKNKACVRYPRAPTTPLHIVVGEDTIECVEICRKLISFGADVNAKDIFGESPMDYAANDEIRALLKAAGATE
eukprot:c5235_g1_i2.p1 GENE.c5235_g1_i2~~c5235_g1_i2.p1  ORF type:complete len:501 (+),score=65.51 c5235_g1_i2:23-1504(+)